jgi:hypothetical protein
MSATPRIITTASQPGTSTVRMLQMYRGDNVVHHVERKIVAVLLVEVARRVTGRGSAVRGDPDLRVDCGGEGRLGAGFGLLGAGGVLLGLGAVGFLGRVPLLGLGGLLFDAGLPLAGPRYRLLVELLVVLLVLLGRGVRGLASGPLPLLLGAVLLRGVAVPPSAGASVVVSDMGVPSRAGSPGGGVRLPGGWVMVRRAARRRPGSLVMTWRAFTDIDVVATRSQGRQWRFRDKFRER